MTVCLLVVSLLASADAGVAAVDSIALPGTAPISMDYLAFDRATGRVWLPAGSSGRIDVIDTTTRAVEGIEGQPTVAKGERVHGASSASVGDGVVYVGNRADKSICAFDARTLKKSGCVTLQSPPDGVLYVAKTHQVWVTTPQVKSLVVIDVKKPTAPKLFGTLVLEGEPEGYAADETRGVFYTNLEDADRTLVIDIGRRKVVSTFTPACGEAGPRGVAVDRERQQLFVACTDGVKTLDAKTGTILGELHTGAGVDNIDYLAASHRLFVASGKDAKLTVVDVAADGSLTARSTHPTSEGCRSVIVTDSGTAYLPDSRGGRVVLVTPR